MRIVSEEEFRAQLRTALESLMLSLLHKPAKEIPGCVVGPGRSGAIASVYASHMLGLPFVPYGHMLPGSLGRVLIVDTAEESGATMRKAGRNYAYADPILLTVFKEPPRVAFWYEAAKPQRYRHEVK